MAGEPKRSPSRTGSKQELRVGNPDVMRAAKITATVVGVVALAVGLWYARTAILLAFAGILLAIVLYGASRALAELTALPRLLMLAAVVIGVALFFGVVFATAGPTLALPAGPRHRRRRHDLDQGGGELSPIRPICCRMSIWCKC